MKKIIMGLLLVLGLATSGWATPYNLNLMVGNSGLTSPQDLSGYAGGYGTVDIDAAGHVTFSGNQNVSYLGNTFDFFLTIVSLNVASGSLTPTSISTFGAPIGATTPQYVSLGADNVGGFGTFNVSVGPPTGRGSNQGAPASVQDVFFNLGAVTLANNASGHEAAAHVVVFENGTNLADVIVTGNAGNGDTAPVPEPGTMMLLGVGFLGLAIYGKRRSNA